MDWNCFHSQDSPLLNLQFYPTRGPLVTHRLCWLCRGRLLMHQRLNINMPSMLVCGNVYYISISSSSRFGTADRPAHPPPFQISDHLSMCVWYPIICSPCQTNQYDILENWIRETERSRIICCHVTLSSYHSFCSVAEWDWHGSWLMTEDMWTHPPRQKWKDAPSIKIKKSKSTPPLISSSVVSHMFSSPKATNSLQNQLPNTGASSTSKSSRAAACFWEHYTLVGYAPDIVCSQLHGMNCQS